MGESYCSAKFRTGEELDEALTKALHADTCAINAASACTRSEAAADRSEAAAKTSEQNLEKLNALTQEIVADVLDAASICYVSATVPSSDVGKDGDIGVVTG